MKEVEKLLPDYSYVYLGDNLRTPYGSRTKEEIFKYTKEGVKKLFEQGARLVILACNTSSAVALRRMQKEWLPKKYPDRKVLGIFVPTVENMKNSRAKTVGIFATRATVASGAYVREIAKMNPKIVVLQKACPLLVSMIENGEFSQLDRIVEKYTRELFGKNKKIDTVILGCTHYAIIENIFRKYVSKNVVIISQGIIIAKSLAEYLKKHPEIDGKLRRKGKRKFLTTKKSPHVRQLAELFYGDKINLRFISL